MTDERLRAAVRRAAEPDAPDFDAVLKRRAPRRGVRRGPIAALALLIAAPAVWTLAPRPDAPAPIVAPSVELPDYTSALAPPLRVARLPSTAGLSPAAWKGDSDDEE